MYPQILYWKWNDELLEDGVMESKAQDICNRSCFTDIYIAPHSMTVPKSSISHPVMRKKLLDTCEFFHKNGRRMFYDIDIRSDPDYFFKKCNKIAHMTRIFECDLDAEGFAKFELEENKCFDLRMIARLENIKNFVDEILGAWCFNALGEADFDPNTVCDVKDLCEICEEDGKQFLKVSAGAQNAGKRLICYPSYCVNQMDCMADEYLQCERELFEFVKDIPLDGACVDEWGIRNYIESVNGNSTQRFFYYSDDTAKLYNDYFGRDLKEDLLYFHYSPIGDIGKSIDAVNTYIRTLRRREAEGEEMVYNLTKRYFGKDAFVGCHPTWWGGDVYQTMEILHNGIDWWEVKRDYAQTDERVLIPIRNALARLAPKPVWYNMWYSQRTLDINTYFTETWTNARFGGRTHHLGYECYEPGVVLTFREEGRLEKISVMEEQIAKINKFQKAQPDSRILFLFGMEAYTNWHILNHGVKYVEFKMKGNTDTLALSKELFKKNVLHDVFPSSEVDRGNIKVEGDKAVCNGHTYDAVILVYPDGCNKKTLEFADAFAKVNKNLLVIGKCNYSDNGEKITHKFNTEYKFAEMPHADEVIEVIEKMGVKKNMTENICYFTDNSVIATSDGKLNVGNPLQVNFTLCGKEVAFKGTDFLAIRFENNTPEFCFGTAETLTLDGKSLI